MKKFVVLVREVHVSHMVVEATTDEQAKMKVKEGLGEERMCEYSHTLEDSLWSVEEEK